MNYLKIMVVLFLVAVFGEKRIFCLKKNFLIDFLKPRTALRRARNDARGRKQQPNITGPKTRWSRWNVRPAVTTQIVSQEVGRFA